MQKIAKIDQNYPKYHSQIFAGNYDKFAGNFRRCRQVPCLNTPTREPMYTTTIAHCRKRNGKAILINIK